MTPPCGVVQHLDSTAHLWRRVAHRRSHLTWSKQDKRWLPSTDRALWFNPMLSTSWAEHIERHGEGAAALVQRAPSFPLVFSIEVGTIRALGLNTAHDPADPPIDKPIDCAHVAVTWPETDPDDGVSPLTEDRKIELRMDIAIATSLIFGEITLKPPQ